MMILLDGLLAGDQKTFANATPAARRSGGGDVTDARDQNAIF